MYALSRPSTHSDRRSGFTLVELLVAIAIIALVLGLGIPAFTNISRESRANEAVQTVNGVLRDARTDAISGRYEVAVRFVRADWIADRSTDSDAPRALTDRRAREGRQALIVYRRQPTVVAMSGRMPNMTFERQTLFAPVSGSERLLPEGAWAAPGEGLVEDATRDIGYSNALHAYNGNIALGDQDIERAFEPDSLAAFPDMDDFVVVFDKDGRVRTGWAGRSDAVEMLLYDPASERRRNIPRMNVLERRMYASLVFYEREALRAVGEEASGATAEDRAEFLRLRGRAYFVDPASGVLQPARLNKQ